MTTLPIIDPTVRIIPSEKLVELIRSFKNNSSMTEGVAAIYKNERRNLESIRHIDHSLLTNVDDYKFISTLGSDLPDCSEEFHKLLNVNCDSKSYEHFLIIEDLKWIYEELKTNSVSEQRVYLHELLKDCSVLLPENGYRERNSELETRCKKLRAEQEAREYRAMTRNCNNVKSRKPEDTVAFQLKQINRQLIAIVQFIVSVLAGFAFGFIGVELMIGTLDFGFRLLLGVMCALVIALAEIYFLAKQLSFDDAMIDMKEELKPLKATQKPHED